MPKSSSRDKMRDHRASLRRKGLRPIQMWVTDTRTPAFKAEARRQSAAVGHSPEDAEVNAFIERVTDWDE